MSSSACLQHINHGSQFRAFSLRGDQDGASFMSRFRLSPARLPFPDGHVAFVMPIDGEISVDGDPFNMTEPKAAVNLQRTPDRLVTLAAKKGSAKAVMFFGVPLIQPVFWQGPLALASEDALAEAVSGYQHGAFGKLQSTNG